MKTTTQDAQRPTITRERPIPPVRFNEEDAIKANLDWGANCGPGALAGILGLTLDEVRPHLGDFEQKGYTNPTLMFEALRSLGVCYQCTLNQMSSEHQGMLAFPAFGLARVQFEGPWTRPGVPIRVRYRHTHWVASITRQPAVGVLDVGVFDINCINNGSGWVSLHEWATVLVPWLIKECEPKADGKWHLTHAIEIAESQ